jgi:hypothetical protein
MFGAGLSYTGSMISPLPLALMTQEMDPTVKDWPGLRENGELGRHAIWLAMGTSCTLLLGASTVD